ncbi:hypothetical protein BJ170DRAFT_592367 [Xylariales sp. AK1849]|nr:hypothetical protein BJ170DRAFT_592367 [Xylariales sp. AK1849]
MKYAIAFAAAAPLVAGHGFLTSPTPRNAGDAMASACGTQIYNMMSSDSYGNIQGEEQLVSTDFTDECNLWLCKGMQYADNTNNVQSYTAGEVVAMTYDIRAPHTGVANVSIVDTASNSVIGDALLSWDVYASNSASIPANETSFSVTMPDLGSQCSMAGACVIQHYWYSESAGQTYESCVDFTMGSGGSSDTTSSSAAATSSTAAATASTVATTSSIPVTRAAATTSAPATTTSSVEVVDTTTSAPTPTETGDDDSCDADATSSAPASEATGDGSGDDDSCDAEETETASVSSAVPTTLATRTSSAPVATATSGSGSS